MHMYLFDTDSAWDRYQEFFDTSPTNLTVTDVGEYADIYPAIDKFRKAARRDDWLVIDMAQGLQDMSEDAFIEAAQGVDPLDWITAAVTSREGRGGAYGVNWVGRRKYHQKLTQNVQRWPGHVLFLCAEQELRLPNERTGDKTFADDDELIKLYRRIGYRPQGEDNYSHLFHSVIRMVPGTENKWFITTVKERVIMKANGEEHRPLLKGAEVADFSVTYLVGVAGWSLT